MKKRADWCTSSQVKGAMDSASLLMKPRVIWPPLPANQSQPEFLIRSAKPLSFKSQYDFPKTFIRFNPFMCGANLLHWKHTIDHRSHVAAHKQRHDVLCEQARGGCFLFD